MQLFPLQLMERNSLAQRDLQDTLTVALDLEYPKSFHLHWAEGIQVVQSPALSFGGLSGPGSFQEQTQQ